MHDLSVDTLFCFDYVVLKYIGYYAELPVGLPKTLEDHIVAKVQVTPHSQGSLIHTICVSFNLNIHNAIYTYKCTCNAVDCVFIPSQLHNRVHVRFIYL